MFYNYNLSNKPEFTSIQDLIVLSALPLPTVIYTSLKISVLILLSISSGPWTKELHSPVMQRIMCLSFLVSAAMQLTYFTALSCKTDKQMTRERCTRDSYLV